MDTNGDNPSNNPIPIHNEINYEQFLLATINNRINSDIITVMLLVRIMATIAIGIIADRLNSLPS